MINLFKQLSTCRLYWAIHDSLLKYWWAGGLIIVVLWVGIIFLNSSSEHRRIDKAFFEDLTAADEPHPVNETALTLKTPSVIPATLNTQVKKRNDAPKKEKTEIEIALDELKGKYPSRRYAYWKTVNCKLTAYTPDARSCGPFADGYTSLMDNAYRFDGVAACPEVIPYRSSVLIPGIGIKEVDDTGGAMRQASKKGYYHIDIRVKTNKEAENFGVKWQKVHLFKITN